MIDRVYTVPIAFALGWAVHAGYVNAIKPASLTSCPEPAPAIDRSTGWGWRYVDSAGELCRPVCRYSLNPTVQEIK
jgi:hypothetical protein